jgi:hypothetical protein
MKFLLLPAILLSVFMCKAQGNLVFKPVEEIKAQISEVGAPVFTCHKSGSFMIKCENGTEDMPGAINSQPVPQPLNKADRRGSRYYLTAGRVVTGFGGAFALSGVIMIGVAAQQSHEHPYVGHGYSRTAAIAIAGIELLCGSAPFFIAGPICIAKGKRIRKTERDQSASLSIYPTGLALNF